MLYISLGLQIESWLAAGIALLIIKSGASLLLDTISKIHGERVPKEVADEVERVVSSVDGVLLTSGLLLQDHGPNRISGSVHLTVDGSMTVAEFDELAREVQRRVKEECDVLLVGVTPYPTPDAKAAKGAQEVRRKVVRIVLGHESVVEIRGLYMDSSTSAARFDAIVEYGKGDLRDVREELREACEEACPDWTFSVRAIPNATD